VGSMRGSSLLRRSVYGTAGAALLVASGAIHLDLYLTGYRSIPTIGVLFLFQVIAAFGLALAVLVPVRLVPVRLVPVRVVPVRLAGLGGSLAPAAGALFALATLGGYLLSLRVGLFGFREVRTTAGIVAGIIDVLAFAALALLTLTVVRLAAAAPAPSSTPPVRRTQSRQPGAFSRYSLPAIAVVSVVALALLGADTAAGQGGSAQTAGVLRTTRIGGVPVLTNAKGLTLYWFAPDTSTASHCTGSCASYWPPVLGKPAAGPGVPGRIATITRPDGSTQATYDGHPLYTYIGDAGPGQASGNKLNLNGGLWYEVYASGP
jgi:predicted lipoprotein with Yx(FWY)xxD motif